MKNIYFDLFYVDSIISRPIYIHVSFYSTRDITKNVLVVLGLKLNL